MTFSSTDLVLDHLDGLIAGINDPFLKSRYTGFVAVSAVTAFEVEIRTHVIAFCVAKHKTFGTFAEHMFEKTNARVKLPQLRDEFLSRFGTKYTNRFRSKVDGEETASLRDGRGSLKNSYSNLIQWRHDFVHDGVLPAYATYDEARKAYENGKIVVRCFVESLRR